MSHPEEPPPLPPEHDTLHSESEPGLLQRFVHKSLFPSRVIEGLLGLVRRWVSPELVHRFSDRIEKVGHVLLPQLAALLFVLGVLLFIDGKQTRYAGLWSIGLSILLLLGQFIAMKMFKAIRLQIAATPCVANSRELLDSLAMVFLFSGGFVLVAGLICLVEDRGVALSFVFFIIASLNFYQSVCALHPQMVSLAIVKTASPGQTALGMLGFFTKSLLSLSPVVYGISTMLVWIAAVFVGIDRFDDDSDAIRRYGFVLLPLGFSAAGGAVLFPITVFILFLVGLLLINLMEAILRIPGSRARDPQDNADV